MDGLDDLLGESDYVLLALPLSPETRGLMDVDRIARMKPDGILINVGRAPVVD